MDFFDLECFNTIKNVSDMKPSSEFYSYLSEENNQDETDTPDTHAQTINIHYQCLNKHILKMNKSNIYDETYGCENQYRRE